MPRKLHSAVQGLPERVTHRRSHLGCPAGHKDALFGRAGECHAAPSIPVGELLSAIRPFTCPGDARTLPRSGTALKSQTFTASSECCEHATRPRPFVGRTTGIPELLPVERWSKISRAVLPFRPIVLKWQVRRRKGKPVRLVFAHFSTGEHSGIIPL